MFVDEHLLKKIIIVVLIIRLINHITVVRGYEGAHFHDMNINNIVFIPLTVIIEEISIVNGNTLRN